MLEDLTIETFEPYAGTSFWLDFPNGSKVELSLRRVGKVMESEAARLRRHPFSLYFIGPKSFHLKQHIYHVTHESLAPMDIFIVPIGEQADGYLYEAVFT